MIMTIKNLWARKATSIKVIISFTIMITILCVFMTYLIALDNESKEIVYGYRSGHYYKTHNEELVSGIELENIQSIKNVNKIINYASLEPVHGIYDVEIITDSTDYHRCYHTGYQQGDTPINATTQEIILHKGFIDFVDRASIITPNDVTESDYRWVNPMLIAQGTDKVVGNEIILSAAMIREYKLGDVYGKEIAISYMGTIYDGIKVVGVLNDSYHLLTGNEKSAHMIMSLESDLYQSASSSASMAYYTELNIIDYMTSQSVANDLASVAGIIDFSVGSEYGLAMASTVSIVNIVITGVMVTVGLGIIVALLLNVLTSMGFLMIKKSNYYGILRAYGVQRYTLFNMMFLEIFILAMISAFIAYGLTYAIVALLDIAMASLIGIGVTFTPLNIGMTFFVAIVSSAILACLVALVNYAIIVRKDIVKLLKFTIEG